MAVSVITRMREHPGALQAIILITLILAFGVNLYGLLAGVTTVIPHLFYIPIILAAFFYPRRGVFFAIALSAAYLLTVVAILPGDGLDGISAGARCIVYIIVAAVVSFLSERVNIRERDLAKAKGEWERTFDAMPELIALSDREHRVLRVNRAMATCLGISPEQAIGLKCDDVISRSKIPPQFCSQGMHLKDGEEHAIEVHENNTVRDFYIATTPLYDEAGAPIGCVHIAHDITARKQTEQALRESEEQYRTLVESSFDGIAIHQDGILLYVNQTAARILGAPDPGHFIGIPAIDMVAPAFRERIAERVKQAPGTALGLIREQFVRQDGTLVDVDVTTAPSTWKGRPAAYVTFRDITAQARAENALRESEEKYRSIIEEMQDIFYRTSLDGTITMLSPSASRFSGYDTNDQLIGTDVTRLYSDPADRDRFLDALRKNDSVYGHPLTLTTPDGTIHHVTMSSHFYRDANGTIQGVEGVIHDITEQWRAEEALKSALTKLNMLSSITRHDILNQIMGLRTFLELSREDLKGTRFAVFIEKEDQAAEAIQRQIEFTKFYQDIGVNAPKWQDVAAVIHSAVAQLNLEAIEVRVTVTGVEIFADPLIEKVFYNLMENSLRHGEHVTTMEFSSRDSEAGLVIAYRDNGVGISAEDKKKLFQRGFGKHTGLGLFLSREILTITGITLTENGEPGAGVRFEITVPKDVYRHIS